MKLTNETIDTLKTFAKQNKISQSKLMNIAEKILEPVSDFREKEYTNQQKLQIVLEVVGNDSFSYNDIKEFADIPKHAVAYRINKLKKQGKVIEVGNILRHGKGANPKLFQLTE